MEKNETAAKQNYVKKQIKDLVSGDIVLHSIYRSDGLMLINKNKCLNDYFISVIKKHVLPTASVLVSPSNIEFEDFLRNKDYDSNEFRRDLKEVLKRYKYAIRNEFENINYEKSSTNTDSTNMDAINTHYDNTDTTNTGYTNPITSILSASPYWTSFQINLESAHLRERARNVKKELLNVFKDNHMFNDLFNRIRAYDDLLLINSINTICTSLMCGLTLELTDSELIELAVAALFLNVGYTELPKKEFEDFLKTQEYNGYAMEKHIEVFMKLTLESPFLRKKSIIDGIFDRHEFYNGNGSPKGKKGEEISLFGRILCIADTYDILVGGYSHTDGMHPIEALRVISENKDSMFDDDIIKIFLHRTTYFKLNKPITISNGIKGKIIGFDNYVKSPYLPIVQLENGEIVNLNE